MPYLSKPKNNNKRTSLVPSWMNKKNKSKSNQNNLEIEDNDSPIEYLNYNNQPINNPQPYEKVTYKNTTTKSIERVSPDGEYNKAVETNEQIQEKINYGKSTNSFNYNDNNIIDIEPVKEIKTPTQKILNPKPKKYLNHNTTPSNPYLEKVSQNGLYIKEIDTLDQSNEIKLAAVKQNGLSLKYIKNQNDTICLHAIKQNPFALRFVLNQNEKLCKEALSQSGLALEFVKNKTEELCLLAIKQSPQAIRYVPSSLLSSCIDLSDYVFIYTTNNDLIPSITELRRLKRVLLPLDDTGFNIMNALKYNDIPTNFVVQKHCYVDDDFIDDLRSHNHFVTVI